MLKINNYIYNYKKELNDKFLIIKSIFIIY